MRKQTSNNKELKSSKPNTHKTPARVLVAGRLAFIRKRLELLNRMKATEVVNNGNTTPPINLEVARGVFNSNRARTAYLSESQIAGKKKIDPKKIEEYLASLSNEAKELETAAINSNQENSLTNGI